MLEGIRLARRGFLGAAAVGLVQFATLDTVHAQSSAASSTNKSFGPLKQIVAGVLNVGYAEAGPANGPAVILLHGWPYDIHTYVEVTPLLASAGYRVIVPYLRGYGTTRFLSSATPRNGQQSVLAADVIALMDALKIEQAIIGGCDWGARTANIVAALWPERVKAMVSVSGYLIGNRDLNKKPLPPRRELEMVVPVLLRHRARSRWLRGIPAGLCQADLAAGVTAMEVRRSHLCAQRGCPRQSGPGRHHDSQLPLAAKPDRGRVAVRRAGAAPGGVARHHGAHHHLGRRRERRAASGPGGLCQEVLRPLCTPSHQRRHRAQFATGGTGRIRQGSHGGRPLLTSSVFAGRASPRRTGTPAP